MIYTPGTDPDSVIEPEVVPELTTVLIDISTSEISVADTTTVWSCSGPEIRKVISSDPPAHIVAFVAEIF